VPSDPDFGWMQALSATCQDLNIQEPLTLILSDMFVLRDVTRRSLQVLRKSSKMNKKTNKLVSKNLQALDFRYIEELNITAVLTPSQVVGCANTTICSSVDNTKVKTINANKALEMADMTKKAINQTKKFRKLISTDKKRLIKADKLRDSVLLQLKSVPDTANSCF